MLFFGWTPVEYPERPREQWAAMPIDDELIRWRRIDIGLAPGKSGVPTEIDPIWTDMFVFRAENRCFAVFKSSDGLLCEAQNEDLTAWKAVGRIDGVEGECPNLFPLEGRYVLLRSTYPISYQVGDFDPETREVPRQERRDARTGLRLRQRTSRSMDAEPSQASVYGIPPRAIRHHCVQRPRGALHTAGLGERVQDRARLERVYVSAARAVPDG